MISPIMLGLKYAGSVDGLVSTPMPLSVLPTCVPLTFDKPMRLPMMKFGRYTAPAST